MALLQSDNLYLQMLYDCKLRLQGHTGVDKFSLKSNTLMSMLLEFLAKRFGQCYFSTTFTHKVGSQRKLKIISDVFYFLFHFLVAVGVGFKQSDWLF